MTTDQIIAIIASGIVAMLSFFLRSSFANITSRLDRLETALTELLSELKAGNVTTANNSNEIAILRARQHELSNEIHMLKAITEKCKACVGK